MKYERAINFEASKENDYSTKRSSEVGGKGNKEQQIPECALTLWPDKVFAPEGEKS
jgi:hypothetical protein